MVVQYGPGVLMGKSDITVTYCNITIHPDDHLILGINSSTLFIFISVADMVEWILINSHFVSDLLHYLGDFITDAPPPFPHAHALLNVHRALALPLQFARTWVCLFTPTNVGSCLL